jgi:hypothetical protein
MLNILTTCSTFHCLHKLMRNSFMEAICLEVKHSEFIEINDTWSYIWGNEFYSSTKAYMAFIGFKQVPKHFIWLWKSSCQPKHKVFSGCSYMIDLTQEICSEERLLCWMTTIVLLSTVNRRKLLITFFGDALLLNNVGISPAQQELQTYLSSKPFKT